MANKLLQLGEWDINLKKKFKKHSLTLKTLVNMVAFSAIILFVLWFFQIAFLNFFYEKYTINMMNNVKKTIQLYRGDNIEYILEQLAYENNICIEQFSSNLFQSYNTRISGCLLGRKSNEILAYERRMVSGEASTTLRITDPKYNTKGLLYGVNLNDTYVFMYSPLEDINTTTSILRGQLIYITLFVLILSLIIAYYLSDKLTKPIIDITNKTKKFAEGDYTVDFPKSDITELNELADTLNYAKDELSKTVELKRDLMANVSHDLKTPLTMIKAYAEMIKDYTYKDDIKRNENLDVIIDETDRLNLLVNDILDLSKLQASKEVLDIAEFNIAEEIKNILQRYSVLMEKENYNITYEGPDKAFIKADKNKINQVVYNLVNNAINYTGKDKKVIVLLTEVKDRYLVEVKDTGKGIDKDEQKYIWDKYYKTNKNYTRSVVGSGIGLSIVKEILIYHNFEYGVKSTKGKGATFYFYVNKK